MVLITRILALVSVILLVSLGGAVEAHKDKAPPAAAATGQDGGPAAQPGQAPGAAGGHGPAAMSGMMAEMEPAPTTFLGRLVAWLGRMHPFAVHFPIALFPVAFLALLLARRRGEKVELIRAVIIVAGVASVAAAILGWINAATANPEADIVLAWHRWIGVTLGLVGGALAAWAWRRRDSVDSAGMVALLGAITLTLLVQGFLGGALTHGMEHMMF